MKKKAFILHLVIILAACIAAYATHPRSTCLTKPQYYFDGTSYVPAGIEGETFICLNGGSTPCTYYKDGDNYVPCHVGIFLWMTASGKKAK